MNHWQIHRERGQFPRHNVARNVIEQTSLLTITDWVNILHMLPGEDICHSSGLSERLINLLVRRCLARQVRALGGCLLLVRARRGGTVDGHDIRSLLGEDEGSLGDHADVVLGEEPVCGNEEDVEGHDDGVVLDIKMRVSACVDARGGDLQSIVHTWFTSGILSYHGPEGTSEAHVSSSVWNSLIMTGSTVDRTGLMYESQRRAPIILGFGIAYPCRAT